MNNEENRPVAQWSEPSAHNRLVEGSSPSGPTKLPKKGTKSYYIVVLRQKGWRYDAICKYLDNMNIHSARVLFWKWKNKEKANQLANDWAKNNRDKVNSYYRRWSSNPHVKYENYKKKCKNARVEPLSFEEWSK